MIKILFGAFLFYGLIYDTLGNTAANIGIALVVLYFLLKARYFQRQENNFYEAVREKNYQIQNADKTFVIYPLLSKYSDLYDENGEMIINEFTQCTYTFTLTKKENDDWDIGFYISPMMQSKIDGPFGASITSGEWLWHKYIFSDEFKNSNFDLSKLPYSLNRPLILDTEGNYIESPYSEEE